MTSLREELATALVAYREAAEKLTPAESASHSAKIKELQKALANAIADGACDCSICGVAPIGLRHIHARTRNKNVVWFHTIEIGCPSCNAKAFAETPAKESGSQIGQYEERARKEAVEEWNSKQKAGE